MITESDWKKFKKLREVALERFCQRSLADVQTTLDQTGSTYHEKYLQLFTLIKKTDKNLAQLFDDPSRSHALLHLMLIRSENLLSDEELAVLSPEILAATKRL